MNSVGRALPLLLRGVPRQCSGIGFLSKNVCSPSNFTRSVWHLSSELGKPNQHSLTCCYSSVKSLHSKADKEMVNFLTEEIKMEKEMKKQVPKLDGFEVKTKGPEVELIKKLDQDETISIKLNVNNSTDADIEGEGEQSAEGPPQMKCQPEFIVEVKKGGRILALSCSLQSPHLEESEESHSYDLFSINELTIHEGEWKEQVYSVAGEVMDATMYDLLMNILEDRGIDNEFAVKLIDFCSAYEQSLYLGLLEGLKSFVSK